MFTVTLTEFPSTTLYASLSKPTATESASVIRTRAYCPWFVASVWSPMVIPVGIRPKPMTKLS